LKVGKETTGDWSAIKPQVFAMLMDAFAEEGSGGRGDTV